MGCAGHNGGEASALAAKSATTTIPIVFNSNGIQFGLVVSLNRRSERGLVCDRRRGS
jgi:hypothetical protein